MNYIFRQLIDSDSKTLTYLLADPWSREAVLIDPVRDNFERDITFLRELGLDLIYSLETHVHADHISAGAILRQATGCKLIVGAENSVEGADIFVEDGDAIRFGLQALEVRATPGHTAGCVSYVSANEPKVFTGDTLLIRGCGRTDFQEGCARTLYRSVRDKLWSLKDETLVYPAHDYKGRTVSSIREEKLYNPRLGHGQSEDDFVLIMDQLGLAYPRRMDEAVPANLQCGRLPSEAPPRIPHTFGSHDDFWEVFRTPTGAQNIAPSWVADNRDGIRLVDVRTLEEWLGPDGRIHGASLHPLETVLAESMNWDRNEPIVLYCRSGGRSDQMARQLEEKGFANAVSMKGGVMRWRRLGFEIETDAQG